MSIIKVKDRAGVSLLLRQVGDVRIPPAYSEEVLREVPKLALREDDIILLGWMRSGTHWTYEMICMLINNNTETIRKKKEEDMIEFVPRSTLDNTPSPRVLNTHLLFHQMPEDLKTEKIKVVFLLRDPRDAIVSWHRMQTLLPHYEYKGAWKDWFPLCIYGELDWGSWFDYVRDWERELPKHPNLDVYFWYYEDMQKNPVDELRKLAEFLCIQVNEDLLRAVVDKCHLERMRKDKLPYEWLIDGKNSHYHKGSVGGWKEVFTVKQYEEFENVYRQKMAGSIFEDRYKGSGHVL